jgi:hypothetical protein
MCSKATTVVSYVHNAAADGMGKIGVLVALKGPTRRAIGKQFAMHIAATSPLSLSEATMDPVVVERELAVQTAKALEENATSAKPKPEAGDPQQHHPGPDEAFLSGKHAAGPGLRDQPRPDRRSRRPRMPASKSPASPASRWARASRRKRGLCRRSGKEPGGCSVSFLRRHSGMSGARAGAGWEPGWGPRLKSARGWLCNRFALIIGKGGVVQ